MRRREKVGEGGWASCTIEIAVSAAGRKVASVTTGGSTRTHIRVRSSDALRADLGEDAGLVRRVSA